MADRKKLLAKIKKLPRTPGVYQFLNADGKVIYVGKSRDIKKRVASYFRAGRPTGNRLELLTGETRDVKVIKTSSEAEALIAEGALIKDYAPKFNVELKDDKSYPFLKLTVNEKYPRLHVTRRRINDGAVYYGPYVNVKLLKEALSFIKRIFPLRNCVRMPRSLCLEFHIGQCLGPCEGKASPAEYREVVKQLKKFLEGKKGNLIGTLKEQMNAHSKKREYEKALAVKKRIEALAALVQFKDMGRYPVYGELDELQNALNMDKLPVVIECFDISDTGGNQAVGSMVRFVAGRAKKSEYRRFRIRDTRGIDDYAMIREIVRRRYRRLVDEGKVLPDAVLIDGGKGHLSAASAELEKLGLGDMPLAAIAKEHNHLYIKGKGHPVRLSPGSRLILVIQRVRDEAHRFAISYHRHLRSKEMGS